MNTTCRKGSSQIELQGGYGGVVSLVRAFVQQLFGNICSTKMHIDHRWEMVKSKFTFASKYLFQT
jgi:hypothetical protein